VSDIHVPEQAQVAAQVLDVIQIPAFLSRQTDLLVAAAQTGKPVNIKKGQFQAPEDMNHAIRKICSAGSDKILITERGSSFGYHDLVVDMRSIPIMKKFGFPVVFDATHSAQKPSAADGKSGGNRELAIPLAMAAVAAGADGVFIETHPDPKSALCDGPNSIYLDSLNKLVDSLIRIHAISKTHSTTDNPAGICSKTHAQVKRENLLDKMSKIRLIIFDVDGILTDGRIIFGNNDLEIKSFDVRDGHGIKIAKRFGLDIALVTGRSSKSVKWRASDLGIDHVYQGIWDKKPVLERIVQQLGIKNDEVAVVGDDVVDIPMMRSAGVSFTVPEAPVEALAQADVITRHSGGRGAAREIVEMILKAQGKWDEAMKRYYK
jgi:2-dehydro-3-deoxyphosphooctonate aldolase (KDO 8-P synthase)